MLSMLTLLSAIAIVLHSDHHLLVKRATIEEQLPAARMAWEAERARLRAECEQRRQEQIAQKKAEREREREEEQKRKQEQEREHEQKREQEREAASRRESQLPVAEPLTDGDSLPRWLQGNGSFNLEVVGESQYQRELERVCGGRTSRGENSVVNAWLILEDDNPYDAKAVAVFIKGVKVGHLSRDHARDFRVRVRKERLQGNEFPCQANIRGGWDRGHDDKGFYGVWLDVALYMRSR
jgi:hypothetical protein